MKAIVKRPESTFTPARRRIVTSLSCSAVHRRWLPLWFFARHHSAVFRDDGDGRAVEFRWRQRPPLVLVRHGFDDEHL